MRKSILTLALCCVGLAGAQAQEFMIDSIAKGTTPYVGNGGDMGQIIYTYYKRTQKPNTLKVDLLDPQMKSMSTLNIDTKDLGEVVSSGTNGQLFGFVFYNRSKKNATLYITDPNGQTSEKMSLKGINSIDDKAYIVFAMDPENFILIQGTRSGYKATCYNTKLEEQWNVTGKKELVSIKPNMDIIHLLCKEESGGAVKFTIANLQVNEGTLVTQTDMVDGDDNFYPLFINIAEGIGSTGGFYFTGGKGIDKTPEGIYMSSLTPDGIIEQIVKTPYSQVIQDIKSGYAQKLTSGEYKMMLHEGTRKMDGSGFVMNGEIYSTKKMADGSIRVTIYDIITMYYDPELKYEKTVVTKKHSKECVVKGSITTQNDIEIGKWVKEKNFFDFRTYKETDAVPNIVCTQDDSHTYQLCARVPGDTVIINGVCFIIDQLAGERDGELVLNSDDHNNMKGLGIINIGMPDKCVLYALKDNRVMIWTNPYPENKEYQDEPTEDIPPVDDAPPTPEEDTPPPVQDEQ